MGERILVKMIYGFNAFPIKFPACLFFSFENGNWQADSKLYMADKDPRTAKAI